MITKLLCIYSEDMKFSGVNMNNSRQEIWTHFIPKGGKGGVYKQNCAITVAISKKYPELKEDLLSNILSQYQDEFC